MTASAGRNGVPYLTLTIKHDLFPVRIGTLTVALLLILSFHAIFQDSGATPAGPEASGEVSS